MGAVPCPLQQAPEALNGVRVRIAVRVGDRVIDDGMVVARLGGVVRLVLIGDQQRSARIDGLFEKPDDALPGQIVGDTGGNLPAPLDPRQ